MLITAPNAETDREEVMKEIKRQIGKNRDYVFIDSLGVKNYLGLIPYCSFVIGNSSSGIIEVPYFKIPTINIGSRQQGRMRHESVIVTGYGVESIKKAIDKATQKKFRESLKNMEYKFGNGNAASKMVKIMESLSGRNNILEKKLEFSC